MFIEHPPFLGTPQLLSIVNGLVGGDEIDCWNAWEVGRQGMNLIVGGNFEDISMKRKNKVRSLCTVNSKVKINDYVISIESTILFQRIIKLDSSKEEFSSYFCYEMASIPLSIFDEFAMREADSSKIINLFLTIAAPVSEPNFFLIAGNHLLDVDIEFNIREYV